VAGAYNDPWRASVGVDVQVHDGESRRVFLVVFPTVTDQNAETTTGPRVSAAGMAGGPRGASGRRATGDAHARARGASGKKVGRAASAGASSLPVQGMTETPSRDAEVASPPTGATAEGTADRQAAIERPATEPLRLFDDAEFGVAPGLAAAGRRRAGRARTHRDGPCLPASPSRGQTAQVRGVASSPASAVGDAAKSADGDSGAGRGGSVAESDDDVGAAPDAQYVGPRPADVAGTAGLAPRLVTVAAAASLLGVGRSTAYELIADGELRVVHIRRSARVPVEEIDAFVARLQRQAEHDASPDVHPGPR